MESTVQPVTYVTYENLLPFDTEESLSTIANQIAQNLSITPETEWEAHFKSINDLRRLRKFHRYEFYQVMNAMKIRKVIPKFVNSIRSNLSKLALILIKEIFSEYQSDYLDDNGQTVKPLTKLFKKLLPEAVIKSASEKIFIKEEAVECLNNVAQFMLYDQAILVLLKMCSHINLKASENAFETLGKLITQIDVNSIECWDDIIQGILALWKMKKDPYVKRPGKILLQIEDKLGKEAFDKVISSHTPSEEISSISECVNYYTSKCIKKSKSMEKPLKERIREFKVKKEIESINSPDENN